MADRVVLTPGVVPPDMVMVAMMMLPKGRTCVLTGMAKFTDMMVPLILPDMVSSCKTLKGVLYREMNPREAMRRLRQSRPRSESKPTARRPEPAPPPSQIRETLFSVLHTHLPLHRGHTLNTWPTATTRDPTSEKKPN
jgi:hypothetical protein